MPNAAPVLDDGWLDEIMIRGKLGELHLAALPLDNLPAEHPFDFSSGGWSSRTSTRAFDMHVSRLFRANELICWMLGHRILWTVNRSWGGALLPKCQRCHLDFAGFNRR
jgi:hypothetical protein